MTRALRRRWRELLAIVALAVLGLATSSYIFTHQNRELPSWIPLIGDDPFVVHAEFETAQGVTPGQGQPVELAGVVVGRIGAVRLDRGRAVVTLNLERRYARLYRDATALLRPRTFLKDMLVALSPGTRAAGAMPDGATIPLANTLPDVSLDELLSTLDADTRAALVSLAQGTGEGLGGQGDELSAAFRRLDPTTQYLRRINTALAGRRRELARSVTAFSQIATVLGRNGPALTRFVEHSDTVFAGLATERQNLRRSLAELPATVHQVRDISRRALPVLASLRSAAVGLEPGARSLDHGLRALTPFFTETKPVVRSQLRPLARAARDPLRALRAAADGLPQIATSTDVSLQVLNDLLDQLAYDPPGQTPSNVFWSAWAGHQLNSVTAAQDALGPYPHSLLLTGCPSLRLLPAFITADPPLATAVRLANLPREQDVCTP